MLEGSNPCAGDCTEGAYNLRREGCAPAFPSRRVRLIFMSYRSLIILMSTFLIRYLPNKEGSSLFYDVITLSPTQLITFLHEVSPPESQLLTRLQIQSVS